MFQSLSMHTMFRRVLSLGGLVLLLSGLLQAGSPTYAADEAEREDSWVIETDPHTFESIHTRELVLHAAAEPKPALKYRLLPDAADRLDGNSLTFYLKASGFLEQENARAEVQRILTEAAGASVSGESVKVDPYKWQQTPPSEIPLANAKKYLELTSFQIPLLQEAALRTRFDADRRLKEIDDPIGYLLPEIQGMREVARTQSLRCRVAIAEGRLDDALTVLKQQFALAEHLSQEPLLISNLVGIAIASIAWEDALYFVEHKDAPNLYWAIAALPKPLVDMRGAMAYERNLLYYQVKVLREVSETPKPAGYWQDFIDRLMPQIEMLSYEFGSAYTIEDKELRRAAIVATIAAAYPSAKSYLIDELKLPRKQVEAYPTAQVVFLAMVRYYDQLRDEIFKWSYVPLAQARSKTEFHNMGTLISRDSKKYGLFVAPAHILLPAVVSVRNAEGRCDQFLALLQTVEAVRMYAAAHNNELPPNLEELDVPAPIEPFTGKPISYEKIADRAVISGHPLPGVRYKLIVRMAK